LSEKEYAALLKRLELEQGDTQKYSKQWFENQRAWYYSNIPHGCDQCGFDTNEIYELFDELERVKSNNLDLLHAIENKEDDKEKLKYGEVSFCVVDGVEEAYISEVYGNFPIDILQNIQREFRDSGIVVNKDILFINCKPIPISEKQYNSENETLTFIGFQFENIREIKYLDVGDGDHDHDDRML
jgi:hypothetical protein